MFFGEFPVIEKLVFVNPVPFQRQGQCPRRELAVDDTGLDFHRDLELPIPSMEMWRRVIPIEHCNDDTEEPTDFRHK